MDSVQDIDYSKRISIINERLIDENCLVYDEDDFQNRTFFLSSVDFYLKNDWTYKLELRLKELFSLSNEGISLAVFNTANKLLKSFPDSIFVNFDIDSNIYSTSRKTVIIDFYKDENNLFSLEIGKDELGFYIEKNTNFIDYIDSLPLHDTEFETNSKIIKDKLSYFYRD